MARRVCGTFLSEQGPGFHLTRDDAYQLISVVCDVDVTQLVDTNSGVHVICPKGLFSNLRTQAQ